MEIFHQATGELGNLFKCLVEIFHTNHQGTYLPMNGRCKKPDTLLLMEEILHQMISSENPFIPLFTRFYTSQVVVWDFFFHQQYFL